jgi:hypothetical protein
MRPPVPAALVLILAFLPSCIIASKNASTAHDVEKPPSDPPIPESVLTTVDFDAQGISEPVYEAPRDRAFIIRDLRVSEVVDVLVELPGVPATEQLPHTMFDMLHAGAPFEFRSPAGIKVPPSAKLRLRRAVGTNPAVTAFVAGDLVRM